MGLCRLLFVGWIVTAFAGSAPAGTLTIFDNQFSTAAWDAFLVGGAGANPPTISTVGGVSGNGLLTELTGFGAYTYDVDHWKTDVVFLPKDNGEIVSSDWELWLDALSEQNVQVRLLARQGGRRVVAPGIVLTPRGSRTRFTQQGVVFPGLEFSEDAAPIQFGYRLSRGSPLQGTTQHVVSFLNIDLDTVPLVPEPTAISLAFASAVASVAHRRRAS